MKIGILKYPGGHGESELSYVLKRYYDVNVIHVDHSQMSLPDISLLLIPGGFPCRENPFAGVCFESFPVIDAIRHFIADGNYVLGIGSGFQMLCELGALPGRLQLNPSGKFICKYIYVKPEEFDNQLTGGLNDDVILRLPIASNRGRYVADEGELVDMRQLGQILFRYCDWEGRISEKVNFADSTDNIAGICNKEKTVFGILPLPERAIIDFYGDADGAKIFEALMSMLTLHH